MVLILILVATLIIAGFARKSLMLAHTVADAQETMQRRWGTKSCQRFLLANAGSLLERNMLGGPRDHEPWPLPSFVDADFQLGECRFCLRLSDEDAKVNLNALARQGQNPRTALAEAVQHASAASGLLTLIRAPAAPVGVRNQVLFQTWEQVFDLHGEGQSAELVPRLQAATVELTCWGSGQLNIRRASDETVRAVCRGQLSEDSLARLFTQRRMGGYRTVEMLLQRLKMKPQEEAVLKRLLAVDSKCYALWLTAEGPRRSWTSLTIDRSGKGNPSKFETFTW